MTSKTTIFAALAFGSITFVGGSLVTWKLVEKSIQDALAQPQVTRQATDLNTSVPALATAEPAAQPALSPLAQRQANARVAEETTTSDESRATFMALMELAAETHDQANTATTLNESISEDAVAALATGRDEAEVVELLANAANNGLIHIPEGVQAANGQVDARALLFSLVEKAVSEEGIDTSASAQMVNAVASVTPQRPPVSRHTQDAYYVVESGDSLAFIALQYYGRTDAYRVIYEANPGTLSSPDQIRVGQRLLIPAI
ncbi:LysM peptidoglycan-binding domain-containing protein [Aestuariibius sp. HNIBRBA575]|uniref:LysM peptidoglycan-binding domain-containing protein n=1 Tax=Aestuariibius sp. HNIBRBA575 TaxID=3233343 RepID=UPI0034A42725